MTDPAAPRGSPGHGAPSGARDPSRAPTRVLVAIDGSAASDITVRLAGSLPWPNGSVLRVVEAIGLGPSLIGGPWPTMALPASESGDLDEALRHEARDEVEMALRLLEGEGRSVSAAVQRGRAASVIVDEARAMSADLVVVGSRGHGTIASMLLGSVSAEVVDHAPCSVLVARGPTVRRIALAWDGSPFAAAAADAVRSWPIFGGMDVVVTVADIGVGWWTGFSEVRASVGAEPTDLLVETSRAALGHATELAEQMVATLAAPARGNVTADVREGDAATQILAAATDAGADLIVLATHGRTGLARLTLGSVASAVTRHARCSVLVVRPVEPRGSAPGT